MSREENQAVSRILYIAAFLLAMLFICPMLHAAKLQEIYLLPENVNKSIGSTVTMSVMYNVTDNDNTLSGVGIRIHYDSSKLTYLNTTNIAPKNVSIPLEKYEDPNIDGDASTDRMIVIAWSDFNQGQWPNEDLPFKVADVNFQVKSGISSGNTTINTGITSVAAGYYGDAKSATINITSMPTIAWLETTSNISEGIGSVELTAQLSYASLENDVTVPIILAGSADPLTDYNISTQSIVIPSGEQTATVTIDVVNDLMIEPDETIEIKLGTPENALIDYPDTIVLTIENDDAGYYTETIYDDSPKSVTFFGDNFTINGEPASIGDEIGVFDPDGKLCGREIIENEGVYMLIVYGDDSSTPDVDEGAVENDILTFKVWDLSTNTEVTVTDDLFTAKEISLAIPACEHIPPQWTTNNDRWGLNIHVNISGSQEIPLRKGWNLFSFSVNKVYYDSANPPTVATLSNANFEKVDNLKDVLVSIKGKYSLIRNSDVNGAKTFDPNVPAFFNTLHYLAAGYGYWIKMNDICEEEECTLILEGALANPSDKLTLRNGWNLIGCWHTSAQYDSATQPTVDLPSQVEFEKVDSLKDVLSSIQGKYSLVRNTDANGAQTFDPNVPAFFNTLKYMGPGYGYWIKMNVSEPIDFNY